MESLASFEKNNIKTEYSNHSVDINENLTNIIKTAMEDDAPLRVIKQNKTVGLITRKRLLQTVIEGTETS
jgi:predicted transcriptional regulator